MSQTVRTLQGTVIFHIVHHEHEALSYFTDLCWLGRAYAPSLMCRRQPFLELLSPVSWVSILQHIYRFCGDQMHSITVSKSFGTMRKVLLSCLLKFFGLR